MITPTFKMIHTADWHLGQKFMSRDRLEEHKVALQWLKATIEENKIDLLLVAGDIFDIQNPPNAAQKLYYEFLVGLKNTHCRHVIITGGNHDSPSMLNAPAELLKFLNIHVIGSATNPISNQILELRDSDGQLEAVVAAVPFLRDKDIRYSIPGESTEERLKRVREGIFNHYETLAKIVENHHYRNIPLITTGHLYAKGASASADQTNIYIGDTENIRASDFPSIFDYVALGHLHREQMVERNKRIRYSGSLIPLSFSETVDPKSVSIVEFDEEGRLGKVLIERVPTSRIIRRISGTYNEIKKSLIELTSEVQLQNHNLNAWVELTLENPVDVIQLEQNLLEIIDDKPIEILKTVLKTRMNSLHTFVQEKSLNELTPLDVFQKKLENYGSDEATDKELMTDTFKELLNWMNETKENEN